jgi:hypothetical protein
MFDTPEMENISRFSNYLSWQPRTVQVSYNHDAEIADTGCWNFFLRWEPSKKMLIHVLQSI